VAAADVAKDGDGVHPHLPPRGCPRNLRRGPTGAVRLLGRQLKGDGTMVTLESTSGFSGLAESGGGAGESGGGGGLLHRGGWDDVISCCG
jgi:hypothetical protein